MFIMKNKKVPVRNMLLAICTALAIWMVGALLIHQQTLSTYQAEDEISMANAISRIDMIFDTVSQSLGKASDLYSNHCAEMAHSLRQLTALSPYSRSFSMAKQGTIYCSSLAGEVAIPVSDYFKNDRKLSFSYGPVPAQKTQVINLKRQFRNVEIIASIPGFYFYNDLAGQNDKEQHYLSIDGHYLDSSGQLRTAPLTRDNTRTRVQASTNYNYSLVYVLPDSYTWRQYYHASAALFFVLLAIGPLAGVWVYSTLIKPKSLRKKLEVAIDRGEIQPWFQPQVDTLTGELIGCEVLARWISTGDGIIPPNQFIPLAEESGLVIPMTRHLMRQVRSWLLAERHHITPGFHVSINFSSRHILSGQIIEDCRHFLNGLPDGLIHLVVEITESEILNDNRQINDVLTQLHQLGVIIAIDDFGTGYSNLSYLQDYPLDILKVDRKFMTHLEPEFAHRHLIAGIIDISKKLDLRTVVEGVETEKHVESLKQLGATWLQGFYYGKPVSAGEFSRTWLRNTSA